MNNKLIIFVLLTSLTNSALQADVDTTDIDILVCPQAGQQIKFDGLSLTELDFYDTACYLRPDNDTGLLKPYAMRISSSANKSNKVAMRAPGINSVS